MSDSVDPDCGTPIGRRTWRPLRASAGLIAIAGSCDLCYPEDGVKPGDLVGRSTLGELHKPADPGGLEPRNVVTSAGRQG